MLKRYLLLCSVCFLSAFCIIATSTFAESPSSSHEFEVVTDENSLNSLEKEFIEYAKKNKGVHQYGSLYVIALGAQPNPGYGLEFKEQKQTLEQLLLYVEKKYPKLEVAYPAVISYPYIVGRLDIPPYTTLSVLDSNSKKALFESNTALNFEKKRFIQDNTKEWSITFNKSISRASLDSFRIFIERMDIKDQHPVHLLLDKENKKIAKVKPVVPYEKGVTYLLHIKNSKNGNHTIIPFEIKEQVEKVELEYDFTNGLNGWEGDFADLPIAYDKEDYSLDFGHKPIPLNGKTVKKNGLLMSGVNRSDDLFMYAKKKIGKAEGLLPNQTYLLNMELEFYTDVQAGLVGVGGSPGEAVYVKAGGASIEPKTIQMNSDLRMNIDKGEQASSGKNAIVIGNVAKSEGVIKEYELKRLKMNEPIKVKTNADGELWAIFGTDSGFEGQTTLYYTNVIIELEKEN